MSVSNIIGQKVLQSKVDNIISELGDKKGNVLAIAGDSSMGKTFILESYFEKYKVNQNIRAVYTDNQEPIGNFKVSMIQPLLPFSKIIQQLMESAGTAQKRFAVNVGMTTLASIPVIGDVFYAVKEYGRDWRQYKREKSSETAKKMNATVADFYDTIISVSEVQPVLILLDNMHNADTISIELLQSLTEKISDLPVSIIFTFNPSGIGNKIGPFENYIIGHQSKNDVDFINLEPFSLEGIRTFCKQKMANYKPNSVFEEWLMNKTYGIPGIIDGYIRHFTKKSIYEAQGEIDFSNTDIFPDDLNNAFANTVQDLNDDEVNLLSICSVEGKEFSAFVVAQLLNTDVLSAIKKLKSLQNKTYIFKSTGAKPKYGVVTTVYEFTQAYYHSYFDSKLEYEERVSLHGQLAAFLRAKLDETTNKSLKNELAPYIVAHSIISGDDETAKEMLVMSAKAANEIDSKEIIENAFNIYQDISGKSENKESNESDSVIFRELLGNAIISMPSYEMGVAAPQSFDSNNYPIDFNFVRRAVVDEYHKGNYIKAYEIADTYLTNHRETLKASEKAQMMALMARCDIESENYDNAGKLCNEALELALASNEPVVEAFIQNVRAIIEMKKGNNEEAYRILQNAAKKTMRLPPEIRLVTISNIGLLLRSINDKNAERFLLAVRRMTKQLNFEEFAYDIFR